MSGQRSPTHHHGQLITTHPAEGRAQRQYGGGNSVLVHIRLVLQRTVEQLDDHVELLVLEHGAVALHVEAELVDER